MDLIQAGAAPAALPAQVCIQCKGRKKKCDKQLPCCTLCKTPCWLNHVCRRMLKCTYEPVILAATGRPRERPKNALYRSRLSKFHVHSPPLSIWGGASNEPDNAVPRWQISPALMAALSGYALDGGPLALSSPFSSQSVDHSVTKQVLDLITSNGETVPGVISAYTASVGVWLPVIHRESLEARVRQLNDQPCARLSALLCCIFLLTRLPNEKSQEQHMRTNIYFVTKALLSAILDTGEAGLDIVCASLLMAVYETGHDLVNVAQVSIAISARLGLKLLNARRRGLSDGDRLQDTDEGILWWAITLQDSYMSLIGSTDDINISHYSIPIPSDPDERGKASGDFKKTPSGVPIRHAQTIMGPFCRSAQAAVMVGQVLRVRLGALDRVLNEDHIASLDHSIQTLTFDLLEYAAHGWEEACSAIGLSVSSIVTLHETRLAAPNMDRSKDPYSVSAIRTATKIVIDTAYKFNTDRAFIAIPPLPIPATFAVWQASMYHIEYAGEEFGSPQWNYEMNALVDALSQFSRRWFVGKRYIREIEHRLDIAWRKQREVMGA